MSRSEEKRKAFRDLTTDLCDKLRATLKLDSTARFCTQGVYQAKIAVKTEDPSDACHQGSSNQFQCVEKDVYIVNPLEYSWEFYDRYLELINERQKVLFVAMNSVRRPPNGIPFYENDTFEEWFKGLEFNTKMLKWMGFDSIEDSESGKIFWGCMKQHFFSIPKDFFQHCFVINFCPLLFVDEERSCNIPLSHLDHYNFLVEALVKSCSAAFRMFVKILDPELIVSIGAYADDRMWECFIENYVEGDNLKTISQPVAISYQQGYLSLEDKIDKWRNKVDEELGNNAVWRKVTKGE